MKLCIVTHRVSLGDGQGRVNYAVVRHAIGAGHQVTLLASEVAPDLLHHPLVSWINLPVDGLPTELLRNLVFSWRSGRWLQKHAAEFDLIKLNGAITNFPADVNAVHFVHSDWLRFAKRSLRESPASNTPGLRGLYQRCYTLLNAHWERQAFGRSQVLVAVSHAMRQSLIDLGVPAAKIRVIANGVDLTEFSPGHAERSHWDLPETVPLALFAGDIKTPRKNLETVLHAMTQVPALHLAVAGDPAGSPYPALAASLGLGDRVHFLGYRRDLATLMNAVDLFVFPSRYETSGLVLLEAMAAGLPVVTAATVGGAEIVTPECGVVLPDPNDQPALAQILQTLVADPQRRSQMGQAARRRAETQTWDVTAQQYLTLFETLAPSPARHEADRHHPHLLPH
ncbi:MAG: glycosyltransferase family 4 protein [Cyanobacteria bacterium J069]|nr:MAG: glycosyltransferase family 1 protein [Cyanobacteria bacterium J069]